MRTAPVEIPPEAVAAAAPPPGPEQGARGRVLPDRAGARLPLGDGGPLRHAAASSSPARRPVWLRMRQPLVAGEEPSPLQRVLVAADVGNGISAALDYRRYLFINVELTVHLERMPAGEWVCVDAVDAAAAERRRHRRVGALRRATAGSAAPLQTLLVAER